MCGGGGAIIIKKERERFKRHSNQMQCSLDPASKKASAKTKHFLYNQGNVNMEYLILKKYYSIVYMKWYYNYVFFF